MSCSVNPLEDQIAREARRVAQQRAALTGGNVSGIRTIRRQLWRTIRCNAAKSKPGFLGIVLDRGWKNLLYLHHKKLIALVGEELDKALKVSPGM